MHTSRRERSESCGIKILFLLQNCGYRNGKQSLPKQGENRKFGEINT